MAEGYIIKEDHYRNALKLSTKLIYKYKEKLNNINVFPVPDRDTGTNLYITIRDTFEKVKNLKYGHFGKFSKSVAEFAFESAVGNSGNILASFLYGIYDYSKEFEVLEPKNLIEAFENGVKFAYESVERPKEGTILTAMRVSVEVAKKEISKGKKNLKEIFKKAIRQSYLALKKFRNKVPSLKKYNVIDSGGLGYILILKSWVKSYKLDIEFNNVKIRGRRRKGYCINIILRSNSKVDVIKKGLEKFGNSIVIRKFEDKIKIHIHSKELEKILLFLRDHGKIVKKVINYI